MLSSLFYDLTKIKDLIMPHVAFGIPDQYESITRPTHVGIIKQVIKATGMPKETFIEYSGDKNDVPVHNSFMNSHSGDTGEPDDYLEWHPVKFTYHGKVKVSVEENIEEETLLSSAVHYTDNFPLFRDDALGVYLYPAYEKVNVTMEFQYRTRDKNEATQWRNDMRRRIRTKYLDESFTAKYEMGVSMTVIAFLKEIWKLREKQGGYGDTFEDYLEKHLADNWTVLANQNAKDAMLSFTQIQLGVLGHFNFTEVPKEESDDKGVNYTIDFTYEYKYDRPYFMILAYPLVVHNQLMPKKFRPDRVVYDPTSIADGRGSYSTTVYNRLLSTSFGKAFRNPRGGHINPYYDEWSPKLPQANSVPLGQFLAAITPDDIRSLTTIDEIEKEGYEIGDEFKRYLRDKRKVIGIRTASVVLISVYENHKRLDHEQWELTEDLEIRLIRDGDIRQTYHVVISLFTELPLLNRETQDDLRKRVKFLNEYLEALNPEIIERGWGAKALRDIYVPQNEWLRIIDLLTYTSETYRNAGNAPWATVMNTHLIRKKNNGTDERNG